MKRVAVVTGGSKGIGLEIALTFVRNEYIVFVISRTAPNIKDQLAKQIRFIEGDISDERNVKSAFEEISRQCGKIDVLINNAGFSEWRPLELIDSEFLDKIFSVNVKGSFFAAKYAAKSMDSGSSIVNISSIAGKRGSTNNSAYVATKFAMNGFTQSLAKELGPRGIRVNGVCPVLIMTPGLEEALSSKHSPGYPDTEEFLKAFIASQSALKRLPTSLDVAEVCIFLASSRASSITGQNLNVDCGVVPS